MTSPPLTCPRNVDPRDVALVLEAYAAERFAFAIEIAAGVDNAESLRVLAELRAERVLELQRWIGAEARC